MTQDSNPSVARSLNHHIQTVAVMCGEDTNVGKSAISRYLLVPALTDLHGSCDYLLVEKFEGGKASPDDIRSEGETQRYRPEQLRDMSRRLAKTRALKKGSVVLDIGGGQNHNFLAALKEAQGSEARIDLFVFVITPAVKIEKVLSSIEELGHLGVDADRLVVIINRAPIDKDFEALVDSGYANSAFKQLDEHSKLLGYRVCSVTLPENPAIPRLRNKPEISLSSLADGTANLQATYERLVNEADAAAQRGDVETSELMMKEADCTFDLEYDGGLAKSMLTRIEQCTAEIFGLPSVAGMTVVEA